jgi:hypothetical protein
MLKAVRAIYKDGKLVFANEDTIPKDGTEIIVTFFEDSDEGISKREAIRALRGRGKGERLVEGLLQSRKEG